jgi:hypothetical protein
LESSWEREKYMDVCTFEERKGIGWWKMGIWRLRGIRGNIDKGGMSCMQAGRRRESHPAM